MRWSTYNIVRLVVAEAARRQEVAAHRIRFVDALCSLLDSKAQDELVPLKVNADRSDRVEPRVRKRRPKEFPVMKKLRSEWRKQLMGNTFADSLSAILECPLFLLGCHKNLSNIDLLRMIGYDFHSAVTLLERWLKQHQRNRSPV